MYTANNVYATIIPQWRFKTEYDDVAQVTKKYQNSRYIGKNCRKRRDVRDTDVIG